MKNSILLKAVFVLSVFMCAPRSLAEDSSKSPLQLRNAMGTVLIAGLVGGVLGLSTLSFYDRPQDNIRNIFFGAGAAMMLATVVMTAEVAEQPVPATAFFRIKTNEHTTIVWVPAIAPNAQSAGVAVAMKF